MASSASSSPITDKRVTQRDRSSSDPPTLVPKITDPNAAGDVSVNSMKATNRKIAGTSTPPVERKSKFSSFGRLFKPWKWRRRKKTSEKFTATSITLERKISMRATKEELIKKGVLPPDAYEDTNNIPLPASTNIESSLQPEKTTANSITTVTTTVDVNDLPKPQESTTDCEETVITAVPMPEPIVPTEDLPPEPKMGIGSSDESKVKIVEMNKENVEPQKEIQFTQPVKNCACVYVHDSLLIASMADSEDRYAAFIDALQDHDAEIFRGAYPSCQGGNGDIIRSDSDSDDEPILYRDDSDDEQYMDGLASKVNRKDSLALKLQNRPSRNILVDRNIIKEKSDVEKQVEKVSLEAKLDRRLSLRPTEEELKQRNILRRRSQKEEKEYKEKMKSILTRKLSFRPTVEELKRRNILQFCDYVEVTHTVEYDRKADKPWTRLTPQDKAAIRKELNEFKSTEMEVHEASRQFTRFHRP
uniref:Phosphatase and actin regulator 1-like n=1 Tax=Saccoglossus kowalevskii TaxID=10224 RepID=A0ABM0MIY6_SACKO|nr:PREDICTED: phosphatase and actin regulator 1-like [Saccoglossus kowalevskii]